MSERFFLPEPFDRPQITLSGSEAHHLAHVLRLATGAQVTLFDGNGSSAQAEVLSVSKRDVQLRVRTVSQEPRSRRQMTLAVAAPKGDRFRWLVEKATELGVDRLVPLLTRRTVVDPRDSKLDKLRQTIIAACKQCGRNHLMELTEPRPFETLLAGETAEASRLFVFDPAGESPRNVLSATDAKQTLIIGPEGGFTDDEIFRAKERGAGFIAFGRTILRTETAALAAATIAGLRSED